MQRRDIERRLQQFKRILLLVEAYTGKQGNSTIASQTFALKPAKSALDPRDSRIRGFSELILTKNVEQYGNKTDKGHTKVPSSKPRSITGRFRRGKTVHHCHP
jgi:hypothetical protein